MLTIRSYFDDSADEKRKRYHAIGGLVGIPQSWDHFDNLWTTATYGLIAPFHATDCETRHGAFEGWSVERSAALMKRLIKIIESTRLVGFGSMVSIPEYFRVFPGSSEHAPYCLLVRHMLINMAQVCADLSSDTLETHGMKVWHENGDISATIARVWHELKRVRSWLYRDYLTDFAIGTKKIPALQGADLVAREAFKHADNLGVRPARKSVEAIKGRLSFHLWTPECLEYLRDNGGPDNLETLTAWGRYQNRPQMIRFYGSTFG
ncbi:MAG: hypothetical protein ABSG65_34065 [Bryobacteraceae bacterium]